MEREHYRALIEKLLAENRDPKDFIMSALTLATDGIKKGFYQDSDGKYSALRHEIMAKHASPRESHPIEWEQIERARNLLLEILQQTTPFFSLTQMNS